MLYVCVRGVMDGCVFCSTSSSVDSEMSTRKKTPSNGYCPMETSGHCLTGKLPTYRRGAQH